MLLELYRYMKDKRPTTQVTSVQSSAHVLTLTTMARNCLDATVAMIDCIYNDEFGSRSPSNLWWYGIYCEYAR